ncbi:MAG: hypothetical protein IPL35_17590 [Sphingobacteriales bacterium]|nr:hypothetical protein [Sphingobacteriales bacterium]
MMERFAAYGFNKKPLGGLFAARIPNRLPQSTPLSAEFMAAVLTHNKDNTKDLNFFLPNVII